MLDISGTIFLSKTEKNGTNIIKIKIFDIHTNKA